MLDDKKDKRAAVQLFQEGVQHGDPDSMVSLAKMIQNDNERLDLLKRAAALGNQEASQIYSADIARRQQSTTET